MRSLTMRIFVTFFVIISAITLCLLFAINNRIETVFDSYVLKNHMMRSDTTMEAHHDQMMGPRNQQNRMNATKIEGNNQLGNDKAVPSSPLNSNTTEGNQNSGAMRNNAFPPTRGNNEIFFLATLRSSLFVIAALFLCISAIASYVLARSIGKPISALNKATQRVADGDFKTPVMVARKDEVGQLAKSFNEMTSRLSTTEALRERYLAAIAHELRTPLAILKANLEGVQDGVIAPEPAQIESLIEEVDRLTRIVNSLKQITLKEGEMGTPKYKKVDLAAMARQIIAKSIPLAKEKGLTLAFEKPEENAIIDGDEGMLQHVFYNLIMNAIKYTEHGNIMVALKKDRADMVLSVADTGIGISEEDQKYIFEPFYRVDPSGNKRTGGSGLGLAIVKHIVLAMRGEVSVKSSNGQGSIFIVRIPIERNI